MFNLKNTISIIFKICSFLTLFCKKIFAKKTLILISKNKIRNFEISSTSQILVFAFSIFVANLFYKSTVYNTIISEKTNKISHLRKINNEFEKELVAINNNLDKINGYFMATANYEKEIDSIKGVGLHDENFNNLFADLNLEENYKKTAIEIASANVILDNIKNLAKERIKGLENKIATIGITLNEEKIKRDNSSYDNNLVALSLNTQDELNKQGGPLELVSQDVQNEDESINIGTVDINDEISYLSNLEKFIYHAPLAKPMNDYYVSSSFGKRVDPIKKVKAVHNGMDFVGPKGEEVLSPSVGEVKIAGNYGAYGKTVVIDHGYGITSRYGHLSAVKVKKGDIVKRGDILGIQGNSGRSTGSHLHYEVRYNNSPLNPRKFLQAGNNIFSQEDI